MTRLEVMRLRGDMIVTYMILSGKDELKPRMFFDLAAEEAGPRMRKVDGVRNIRPAGSKMDIRRYSFSQRVTNPWNSLPNSLKGVGTVEGFKIKFDEFVMSGRLGAR